MFLKKYEGKKEVIGLNGYSQEGYMDILSYDRWMEVNKSTMYKNTSEKINQLNFRNGVSIQELEDFVKSSKELGVTSFEIIVNTDDDHMVIEELVEGFKTAKTFQSDAELKRRYNWYVCELITANNITWNIFDSEYKKYLELQKKFSNGN